MICNKCKKPIKGKSKKIVIERGLVIKRAPICIPCHMKSIAKAFKKAGINYDSKLQLIKLPDGSYEPYEYHIFEDVYKVEEHETDCANLPSLTFNKRLKMHELRYTAADSGGYDVANFVRYFKTLDELLEVLRN